ncbi:hypothetical protein [Winogradskyella thalassocola]|nr:hypothetical protein [Winogradskyella thalassocola]
MTTSLIKKTLWIIYGAVALIAIDSIITSIVYYIFHLTIENNYQFSSKIKLYIFGATLGLYLLSACLLAFFITKKSRLKNYKIKERLPVLPFLIAISIAITLKPLTLYFSEKKLENALDDLSKTNYMSSLNLSSINEFITNSIYICKWSTIIVLVLYLFILNSYAKKH